MMLTIWNSKVKLASDGVIKKVLLFTLISDNITFLETRMKLKKPKFSLGTFGFGQRGNSQISDTQMSLPTYVQVVSKRTAKKDNPKTIFSSTFSLTGHYDSWLVNFIFLTLSLTSWLFLQEISIDFVFNILILWFSKKLI